MGAPVLYEIYGEEGSQNGTIEDGGLVLYGLVH